MLKIAVLYSVENRVQRQIVKGLVSVGSALQGRSIQMELFSSGSTIESDIQRQVLRIKRYQPDLLFTLGTQCTLVSHETLGRKTPFPIIFLATSDPVKLGIVDSLSHPGGSMTGVIGDFPHDELPLQLLLALKPSLKRFVLPHYNEVKGGRVAFEVEKMTQFLRSRKKECVPVALRLGDAFEEKVRPHIKTGDAVVVPKIGITTKDLPILGGICDEKDATLFAENENVIPSHAICGYASDLEFLGRKGIDLLKKIFDEKIPVSELPVYKFKNDGLTQLVFNNTTMIKRGVTLPTNGEYLFTLGDKDFRYCVRLEYDFISSYNSTTER
ncbi:MAG: ABC transporter substrate binding protein, partial [Candidatus Dependentiae bacterium]